MKIGVYQKIVLLM
jgi:hypothetical protein